MFYYFAYGSNMNFEQMKQRCPCPSVVFIKRVYLEGYKFVYDGYSSSRKCAVANVIKRDGCIVWGGLFEIDESCLKKLDYFEGYPNSYDRTILKVRDDEGNEYDAWVYLRKGEKEGEPSSEYRKIVCDGAKDCGLPEDYIEKYLK